MSVFGTGSTEHGSVNQHEMAFSGELGGCTLGTVGCERKEIVWDRNVQLLVNKRRMFHRN